MGGRSARRVPTRESSLPMGTNQEKRNRNLEVKEVYDITSTTLRLWYGGL